ncbi:uncharacterized protein [Physcomitrium patens]|uniref:uncharacterized protein isoform X7 n=1 Tax=Physcomitrium patens TaxID=3218 RepID=UPI003CCD1D01
MKEICQNWVFVFGLPNYRRSWKCPVQDFHSNLLACNYAGWLWRSLKLGALARQSMTFSVTEWAQETFCILDYGQEKYLLGFDVGNWPVCIGRIRLRWSS